MAKQPEFEFKVGDAVRWNPNFSSSLSGCFPKWLVDNGYDPNATMRVTYVKPFDFIKVRLFNQKKNLRHSNGKYEIWHYTHFVKDNFMGDVMAALESEASNA